MDPQTKRGCLWAALGGSVLVLMVGAAVVGGAAWLVYQSSSIKSSPSTPERAAQELESVRTRFTGQAPLIAIDDHEQASIVRRKPAGTTVLTALHVLAFDPGDRQLKRVTLPFWVLRMSSRTAELKLGDDTLHLHGERVTIADVEKAGPGLLVDHVDREGRRVLVWTE
jgi:hypothetical protein